MSITQRFRRRFVLAVLSLLSPLSNAAAPLYFDLGGLILWGLFLVVLFIVLMVIVAMAKTKAIRIFAIIGLLGYVVVPVSCSVEAHRIRAEGEPMTLFTAENQRKENEIFRTFDSLCTNAEALSYKSVMDVTGFRVLEIKPLRYSNAQARGWGSAIDFYAGETVEGNRSVSLPIMENLKRTLPKYMKKGFVDYRNKDGSWERFSLGSDSTTDSKTISSIPASHGIVFEQVFTGYEEKYAVFHISIIVFELQTNRLVARHEGLIHDDYWGAHNNYRLLTRLGGYCRSEPDNFVAQWLSSLVKQEQS